MVYLHTRSGIETPVPPTRTRHLVFSGFPMAGKRQMRLIIESVKICLDGNSVATFYASAARLFRVRGNELMAEGHTLMRTSQDSPDAQRSPKEYLRIWLSVLCGHWDVHRQFPIKKI